MAPDTPEKPKRVLPLFAAAGVLFVVTFTIPHLPKLSPRLSERFGLGTEKGQITFDLTDATGQPVEPAMKTGSKLGVRYDGAGYIYLWLVELEASGKVTVLLPRPTDSGLPWGMRLEPGGATIPEIGVLGPGRRVFYALFSPIPIRREELEAEIKATKSPDPLHAAESLRLRGRAVVKVVHGE